MGSAQGAKRPSTGRAPSSTSGRRESNPRPRAWKARALPPELLPRFMICFVLRIANGEGRIRTSVGIRRQIYSLLPLATRVPLRIGSDAPAGADGPRRTDDLPITSPLLYP